MRSAIWMPTYLRTVRHLSATTTGGFLLVQILGALFGFLLGTYLSDAIGRKWTFLLSAILSFVMILIFMLAADEQHSAALLSAFRSTSFC